MVFGWFKKNGQEHLAGSGTGEEDGVAGKHDKTMQERGLLPASEEAIGAQRASSSGKVVQMDQDQAPEFVISHVKPVRKNSGLSFLSTALNLVLFACLALLALSGYALVKYNEKGPLKEDRIISVPRGAGLAKIANILTKEGVIKNRNLFKAAVYAKKLQKKLRAGEYSFPAHASMKTVLQTLSFGKTYANKVTIPEGWTSYKVVQRLLKHPKLTGAIDEIPAEGSLLPDTYTFSSYETRSQLIKRMQKAHEVFLATAWANRSSDIPVKTPQEAVTLASIVEKETGIASERYLIAGVFSNRLRKRMRLQSDPTIIYGLVGGKGPLGRGLRRSEIRKKTQYNTYQIPALPPTPIANPGREAIKAVLNPAKTNYLYFVADGSGGHVFAATNAEHVRNVKNWRKVEKEIRARQAKRAAEKIAEQEKKKQLEKLRQAMEKDKQAAVYSDLGGAKKGRSGQAIVKVADRLGHKPVENTDQTGGVKLPKDVEEEQPGTASAIVLLKTSVPVKNPKRK